MSKRTSARFVVSAALIAASYTALTYLSSAFGLAYYGIQFRLSEALNVLAAFTPAAIPGLTIGCILSNINSPFGLYDIVFGTVATLLSSLLIFTISKHTKKAVAVLAVIPPTVLNALAVGFEVAIFTTTDAWSTAFAVTVMQVFISEAIVCSALGIPLYNLIDKRLRHIFD